MFFRGDAAVKFYFMLPFVALAAWLGVQPRVSAGPVGFPSTPSLTIPPARGSFDLTACDYNKQYCAGGVNTPVTFARGPTASQTVAAGASGAKAQMSLQPSPKASATLKATATGSTGNVLLTYFFGVAARSGFTPAPITFSAKGSASAAGDSTALASVQVQTFGAPLGQLFSYTACTAPCADGLPPQGSFSASKRLFIAANTVYSVSMSIDLTVDGVNGQVGLGTAAGSVDPVITIDPDYASGFQLLLSRNVGNVFDDSGKPAF
jgi:hypothetical protein